MRTGTTAGSGRSGPAGCDAPSAGRLRPAGRPLILAGLALIALLLGCAAPARGPGGVATGAGAGASVAAAPAGPAAEPAAPAGTARAAGSTGVTGSAGARTPAAPPKIFVVVKEAGFIRPFENGAPVLTSGPFSAQVRLDPYPPVERADLEVTVLDDRRGEPVADAQVTARADMPGHGHGIAALRLEDRGGGRHGTPIILFMGGDWTIDLEIRKGSGRGVLTLLISTAAS